MTSAMLAVMSLMQVPSGNGVLASRPCAVQNFVHLKKRVPRHAHKRARRVEIGRDKKMDQYSSYMETTRIIYVKVGEDGRQKEDLKTRIKTPPKKSH